MCLKDMKFVRFEKNGAPHWTYSRCFPYDKNVKLLQKGTQVYCAEAKKDNDYFTVDRVENNGHVIHILENNQKGLSTKTSTDQTQDDSQSLTTFHASKIMEKAFRDATKKIPHPLRLHETWLCLIK